MEKKLNMSVTFSKDDNDIIRALNFEDHTVEIEDFVEGEFYFFVINYKYLQKISLEKLQGDVKFEFYITGIEEFFGSNRIPIPSLSIVFFKNQITAELTFLAPRMEWRSSPINYNRYMTLLHKTLSKYEKNNPDVSVSSWGSNPEDLSPTIEIKKNFKSFREVFNYSRQCYNRAIQKTETRLRWTSTDLSEFDKEEQFTKELIIPLFKSLSFQNVRYNGGQKEFGKDVICFKKNELGLNEFWGIQVKNDDIRGSANSDLNTIINQIDDAFKVPFN